MKNKRRKVKLSIRLSPDLFDMICELEPLYSSFTEALEVVLREWRYTQFHIDKLLKLENLRDFLIESEIQHNRKRRLLNAK